MSLSPTEHKLLSFMCMHGVNVELHIDVLWEQLSGDITNGSSLRNMQQYVGAFVSRINKKQGKYTIVPGEKLKHTYCVQLKKSAD